MSVSLLENASLTLALTVTAIVITIIYLSTKLKLYLSPGPWGVPVLGYYPFLRRDYPVQLAEMAKKYGDVYLLNVCGKVLVNLGSHKALKEAHIKKADCFSRRFQDYCMLDLLFSSGVFMLNDEPWRVQRKFVVQSMRELGLGARQQLLKRPLEDAVKDVLEVLKKSNGQFVNISEVLVENCTDISKYLVLGNRISDESFKKLNQAYVATVGPSGSYNMLLLGLIPKFFIIPYIKGYKEVLEGKRQMAAIVHEVVADHKDNFDPDHPGDLIDLYLKEKKMLQDKGDPKVKYFTDKGLVATLMQVYGDTGASIGTVLADFFKQLAPHVNVQNAIYEEVIREIGISRLPTYEDRSKLPYTNAVIKELERNIPFFPAVPSLECTRDTTICGVFIPKGAVTVLNFRAIHQNPFTYKNPEIFDPERFLPDGQGSSSREEMPVKFGVGKRACAGEQLVNLEVFVFLTSVMQQFSLHLEQETAQKGRVTTYQETHGCRLRAVPR